MTRKNIPAKAKIDDWNQALGPHLTANALPCVIEAVERAEMGKEPAWLDELLPEGFEHKHTPAQTNRVQRG
jgi:hypothetical protein